MAIEEHTRDDVNNFMARGAKLQKEILFDEATENVSIDKFKRISKRRMILTLIALTDRENENFVSAVEPFLRNELGTFAWNSLNFVLVNSDRTDELLNSDFLSPQFIKTISLAAKRGRLNDDDAKILNEIESRMACIRILQFGSLKQRISMTMKDLPEGALTRLLVTADDVLLNRAIVWAKTVS